MSISLYSFIVSRPHFSYVNITEKIDNANAVLHPELLGPHKYIINLNN